MSSGKKSQRTAIFLIIFRLKSQADDKADDNCCDWQFKG